MDQARLSQKIFITLLLLISVNQLISVAGTSYRQAYVASYADDFEIEKFEDCPSWFSPLRTPDGQQFGCFRIISNYMNWHSAHQACSALRPSAHLVIINNAEENEAVRHYMRSHGVGPYYWTAGLRDNCTSPFYWETGSSRHPITYTNWVEIYPYCHPAPQTCIFSSFTSGDWRNCDCSSCYPVSALCQLA